MRGRLLHLASGFESACWRTGTYAPWIHVSFPPYRAHICICCQQHWGISGCLLCLTTLMFCTESSAAPAGSWVAHNLRWYVVKGVKMTPKELPNSEISIYPMLNECLKSNRSQLDEKRQCSHQRNRSFHTSHYNHLRTSYSRGASRSSFWRNLSSWTWNTSITWTYWRQSAQTNNGLF